MTGQDLDQDLEDIVDVLLEGTILKTDAEDSLGGVSWENFVCQEVYLELTANVTQNQPNGN